MKTATSDEIKALFDIVWPQSNVEVLRVDEDRVDVKVWQMYDAPGLTYAQLKQVAEFFGTENINDDDRFHHGGCETCDWGSEHGFTLTVRPS